MGESNSTTSTGISDVTALGIAIAVNISWGMTHDIWWTILHGILGWFYVIYRCIVGY
jgi:hypothetical protein